MSHSFRCVLARVLIVFGLLWVAAPPPARADDLKSIGIEVIAASIAIGVLVGVGIYFAVRAPSVRGCVASNADGTLTLQGSKPSDPLYLLQDKTGDLQAGNRVQVVGRKKKDAQNRKLLVVSRIEKMYGACAPPVPAHALNGKPFSVSPELSGMQLAGAQ